MELTDLLNAWVYAIAVENWNDMAVVFSPRQLSRVECHEESDGEASVGWDCMFSPMPHLCTFQDSEVCVNLGGKSDVGFSANCTQSDFFFLFLETLEDFDGGIVSHFDYFLFYPCTSTIKFPSRSAGGVGGTTQCQHALPVILS